MEKALERTPTSNSIQPENTISDKRTPPQDPRTDEKFRNSGSECIKMGTPDLLKVPKAFKYPERYTSPTDLMISPVSKGLLARNRKASGLLPPTRNQPKEVGLFV